MRNTIFIICLCIFVFSIEKIESQGISKKASEALRESGLSLDEAKQLLKSQGINIDNNKNKPRPTDNESINVQKRQEIIYDVKKASDYDKTVETNTKINFEDGINSEEVPDDDKKSEVNKNEIPSLSLQRSENDKNYFGYNAFQTDPEIFDNSSIQSITPDYLIGPGDEIIIMLWGETEFNTPFIVERDGYIFINNLGRVYVNGLTLDKLEKKLYKLLKKVYASLDSKGGGASTYLDVTLGSLVLRPLRIFILGEVGKPGAYSVKPSTSIYTSLYYIGGPTVNGSLRDVQLIRNGKKIASIDFYNFLLKGQKKGDIRLQRDDIIFIPVRKNTIEVIGEINRRSIYELEDDETLFDLIDIAGGIKNTTYMNRVKVDRILPPEVRIKGKINRTIIDIDLKKIINKSETYKLIDGDKIEFFPITTDLQNIITISGQVKRPGVYDFGKGLSVKELVIKGEGILNNTYLEKADIIRLDDKMNESYISLNLSKALDNDPKHNIKLKPGDRLTIYNTNELKYKRNISISGFVNRSIDMELKKGLKLKDFIFMAGGFKNELRLMDTYLERAELTRVNDDLKTTTLIPFRLDSLLANKGLANLELKMGDNVQIYSREAVIGKYSNSVQINGNVLRPGTYALTKKMKIRDLLFKVGFAENLDYQINTIMGKAHLSRLNPNRKNRTLNSFSLDKIINGEEANNFLLMDGDEITIFSSSSFEANEYVKITGLISSPGVYTFKDSLTLKDLILEAGGVPSLALYRLRAEIARVRDLFSGSRDIEIINFDFDYKLEEITSLKSQKIGENNIYLRKNDLITIRRHPFFTEEIPVKIIGYIKYPGEYVIVKDKELVSNIIKRAGGLISNAYPTASTLLRDSISIKLSFDEIIKNPRSKYNFEVRPGDQINIKGRPNLIVISGEVNSPGNYQFIKNQNLKDYVNMAGGYTKEASKYATFVSYPNGQSKKIKFLSLISPPIIDGSTIVVGKKDDVAPFDLTSYASSVTQIFNEVSQAYLMIILALRSVPN